MEKNVHPSSVSGELGPLGSAQGDRAPLRWCQSRCGTPRPEVHQKPQWRCTKFRGYLPRLGIFSSGLAVAVFQEGLGLFCGLPSRCRARKQSAFLQLHSFQAFFYFLSHLKIYILPLKILHYSLCAIYLTWVLHSHPSHDF